MMSTLKNINRKAFSLIEVLVATMLVGIAVAALMFSTASYTQANGYGIDISTAEFLIQEIKEMSFSLSVVDPQNGDATFGPEADETTTAGYDDLDDFDGAELSPPIDMTGTELADFSSFTQKITVENVSHADLNTVVADHASSIVKITVTVTKNGKEISSSSWIRARL